MKNKGSTLVETIVSLAVLLMGVVLISNIILNLKNSQEYRNLREEANRISYAIESEIKYNYKKEELKEIFSEVKVIELNFDKEFLKKLLYKDLFTFTLGHGIAIKISDSTDSNIKEFTILIKDSKGAILSERRFYKNNWMDL
ncbi:type II secretion system protein [Clostridium sp.]|uniref:type II secretion system protein n=1 Tax=Clostridium sp. TaxID=1506 RepID=UPI0026129933|nr:type II secretion system protein [Clostridium sp.]